MPIYAYRCEACGHAKDVLQKISDPVLTTCPACGADTFRKQLTAAGFQLKGSGWYVTDFKGGANAGARSSDAAKPEAGGETKPAATTETKTDTQSDGGTTSAAPAAGCGGGCACH